MIQKAMAMAQYGVPQRMVATLMGIDCTTLMKYYENEMTMGKAMASVKIAQTLFQIAVGDPEKGIPPNLSALIFWTKAQMGWRESSVQQHQMIDKDGNPINAGPQYTIPADEARQLAADLDAAI